ncbi:hypothetical protein MTO96_038191 [Rhipicephalus appendiculatus]
MHRRDDQEGDRLLTDSPTPYVVVVAALPAADAVVEESTPPTRPATLHGRPPVSPSPSRPATSQGAQQLNQLGEPAASPRGRSYRDVATWDQPGWRGPTPGRVCLREALAPARKGPHGNGPGPPLPPVPRQNCRGRGPEGERGRPSGAGTRLCECGAVVVHSSHELGEIAPAPHRSHRAT